MLSFSFCYLLFCFLLRQILILYIPCLCLFLYPSFIFTFLYFTCLFWILPFSVSVLFLCHFLHLLLALQSQLCFFLPSWRPPSPLLSKLKSLDWSKATINDLPHLPPLSFTLSFTLFLTLSLTNIHFLISPTSISHMLMLILSPTLLHLSTPNFTHTNPCSHLHRHTHTHTHSLPLFFAQSIDS